MRSESGRTLGSYVVRFHLCEMPRSRKSAATGRRLPVARGGGRGGARGAGAAAQSTWGFIRGAGGRKVAGGREGGLHSTVTVPNATGLLALKWLVLCQFCLNFLKTEKKKNIA